LWEHLDIRVKRGGHPALEKKGVRQAIAYAIDRAAIARLYGGDGSRPSESAVLRLGSPGYRANWARYRHRPDEARRLLESEGCRRGGDGIYACDGVRLSLRFVTTAAAGGPREQTLQLIQRQLAQVGIAVAPVFTSIGVLAQQILPSGDFDLALFNWIFGVDRSSLADLYSCGGSQNNAGYCQRLVTRDLDQARRILRSSRLAEVLNRADAQLAKDVPVIPLVERPIIAAFSSSVRGVSLETRAWNPFQNAENWWLDR
jgi:peptide/nickel transport system substrate-binding protein